MVDLPGLVGERAGGCGHVLGERAVAVRVAQHAEHLVTRLVERCPDPDGLDDTGDVPPENERRPSQ
jgi:hypothetical protein